MNKTEEVTEKLYKKVIDNGVMNLWRSHLETIAELYPDQAEEAMDTFLKMRQQKSIMRPQRYITTIAATLADKQAVKKNKVKSREEFINGGAV